MTITRADAEYELVSRARNRLVAAGMSIEVQGANQDLNGPIGAGLRAVGITPASLVLVTDADVAGVTDLLLDKFLDMAELRLLENMIGNLSLVDVKSGPLEEKLSQLAGQMKDSLAAKRTLLADKYGETALEAAATTFSVSIDRTDGWSENADESE